MSHVITSPITPVIGSGPPSPGGPPPGVNPITGPGGPGIPAGPVSPFAPFSPSPPREPCRVKKIM